MHKRQQKKWWGGNGGFRGSLTTRSQGFPVVHMQTAAFRWRREDASFNEAITTVACFVWRAYAKACRMTSRATFTLFSLTRSAFELRKLSQIITNIAMKICFANDVSFLGPFLVSRNDTSATCARDEQTINCYSDTFLCDTTRTRKDFRARLGMKMTGE